MLVYKVYKDAKKQFRWSLIAANNRVVANSGEGYHNKEDLLHAIDLISGDSHEIKFVRAKPTTSKRAKKC